MKKDGIFNCNKFVDVEAPNNVKCLINNHFVNMSPAMGCAGPVKRWHTHTRDSLQLSKKVCSLQGAVEKLTVPG
jgi:hypothetical protein